MKLFGLKRTDHQHKRIDTDNRMLGSMKMFGRSYFLVPNSIKNDLGNGKQMVVINSKKRRIVRMDRNPLQVRKAVLADSRNRKARKRYRKNKETLESLRGFKFPNNYTDVKPEYLAEQPLVERNGNRVIKLDKKTEIEVALRVDPLEAINKYIAWHQSQEDPTRMRKILIGSERQQLEKPLELNF